MIILPKKLNDYTKAQNDYAILCFIAVVIYVRTKPKPKREWRCEAPPLSFGFEEKSCTLMSAALLL